MTEALGESSYLIDTGLYGPQHAACYLISDNDELAIIDTGTQHGVPQVMQAIADAGGSPEQVRYVIPTHVHLDHAGATGYLMEICQNATLIVHPKGLQHMVDPSKLQAGAMAVYGEAAFLRDFGTLKPVPESRAQAAEDGARFTLGQRTLKFLDTPGHANHHGCIFDEQSGFLFTGDTFGLAYRDFQTRGEPLVVATTTPVAFDPEGWFDSLDRMMALNPRTCCLTHFGRVDQPANHVEALRASIEAHRQIALNEESRDPDGREDRLRLAVEALLVDAGTAHNGLDPRRVRKIFESDIELNAQGLNVWLIRRAKKRDQDQG